MAKQQTFIHNGPCNMTPVYIICSSDGVTMMVYYLLLFLLSGASAQETHDRDQWWLGASVCALLVLCVFCWAMFSPPFFSDQIGPYQPAPLIRVQIEQKDHGPFVPAQRSASP